MYGKLSEGYVRHVLSCVATTMCQPHTTGATAVDRLLTALHSHGVTGLDVQAVGRITRTLWLDEKRAAAFEQEVSERLTRAVRLADAADDLTGEELESCLKGAGIVGYVISTEQFGESEAEPLPDYWGIDPVAFVTGGRDDDDDEDGFR